mgnify:CR=1 FL=1
MNNLYWFGLGLALSAVLWGVMLLVLMLLPAYASAFGTSTLTNSTSITIQSTTSSQQIVACFTMIANSTITLTKHCDVVPSVFLTTTSTISSQSTRVVSDYTRLGILLSIVLVAVLATIAYFTRKNKK